MWALGTSPYGLGLSGEGFWGLCEAEFFALLDVRQEVMSEQAKAIAHLRADLYNTSAREFKQHFTADDFLQGRGQSLEERIRELEAQGYTKSQACALATSKRSKKDNLMVFKVAASGAAAQAETPQRRASTRRRKT